MKTITGTYRNKENWTFIIRWHKLGKSYSIRVLDASETYQETKGIREKLKRDYIEKFISDMSKVA